MSVFSSLQRYYPWISSPVIACAPMSPFAGPALVHAVSKAKGIGFLGAIPDAKAMRRALEDTCELFTGHRSLEPGATLPVGLGALLFVQELDYVCALIEEFRPVAVWLFAAKNIHDYKTWTDRIRGVCKETRIWIQVGNVSDAVYLTKICKPNVLVMQGSDAGGHGSERGAGIVSLLPETKDALREIGALGMTIFAAGGIADGRGVAAALTLGADGVVMGTRFLASEEVLVHPAYQAAVLQTSDGGQTTVRSKVFDELAGPSMWPENYDGRALIAASYRDHVSGMPIDEIRKLHAEAKIDEDAGFGARQRRAAIWAGTGVGLVRQKVPAFQILNEVREDARKAMERAASRLAT